MEHAAVAGEDLCPRWFVEPVERAGRESGATTTHGGLQGVLMTATMGCRGSFRRWPLGAAGQRG